MRILKLVFSLLLFLPFLSNANPVLKIGMDKENEILSFLDISPDQFIGNMGEMEKKNLKSAKINVTPWVGYYWPLHKGLLAYRYADLDIPRNGSWNYFRNRFDQKSAKEYIDSGNINLLSPAEKYDLLLGDPNFTLTKKMWAYGKEEMEKYSSIKGWAGISHGLALASLNTPIPIHPVTLWSVDKKYKITFSPDDIKALGSMFWSMGSENPRFLGSRCAESSPSSGSHDRVSSEECFDINPGKLHLALVNQIGIGQKAFNMDMAYNEPVWNYPVVGYSFEYFNPKKPRKEVDFQSALISIRKFGNDNFSDYRNEKTQYIIGVKAKVLSTNYKMPEIPGVNSSPKIFEYEYDLELDENLNIVGGEWYSQARPDFLWQAAKDFSPVTNFESEMYNPWDAHTQFFPQYWVSAAIDASSYGIIISPIVNNLFTMSSKGLTGHGTL